MIEATRNIYVVLFCHPHDRFQAAAPAKQLKEKPHSKYLFRNYFRNNRLNKQHCQRAWGQPVLQHFTFFLIYDTQKQRSDNWEVRHGSLFRRTSPEPRPLSIWEGRRAEAAWGGWRSWNGLKHQPVLPFLKHNSNLLIERQLIFQNPPQWACQSLLLLC